MNAEITKLPKLKILIISENQISEFPKEFGEVGSLPNLVELQGCRCGVKKIDGLPRNLKIINLAGNSIAKFPDCLQNLKQLEYLDFSYTEIETFGETELSYLSPTIEVLFLAYAYISKVPIQLAKHLNSLKKISLEENEGLESQIPEEILNSPEKTLEWLKNAK